MDIQTILMDKRLYNLLDKYVDNSFDYEEYFDNAIKNINENEIIIPILGVQGAGKSSFINALLMDDNILPTDVDETTCVPVEVRYGTNKEEAIIYFEGKKEEKINITEIEKYVHNEYNPANELDVKSITIFSDSDILKNNVVIVDLPGVGSLTPKNQKTTLEYVDKLVCAVFMVRTNPPITKTERNFINALWPKLPNTIFVQNKWNDESYDDAKEAKEHNETVLEGINFNHKVDKNITVTIVDVYDAITGKLSNDSKKYEESGIYSVISDLEEISKNYTHNLKVSLKENLNNLFINIENEIKKNKNIINSNEEQNESRKEKEILEVEEVYSQNKKVINDAKNFLDTEYDDIISSTKKNIREEIENLKTELRRIINLGIVDGEKLNEIYKEQCEIHINKITEELLYKMTDFTQSLEEKLGCIKIKGFDGKYKVTCDFSKKEKFKFEKWISPMCGIAGGLAVFTPIGLIGSVVAAIAFSILGGSLKKKITQARSKATIKDLEPIIESLEKDLKDNIIHDLRKNQDESNETINSLSREMRKELKIQKSSIEEKYTSNYYQVKRDDIDNDLKILNSIVEVFNE